MATDKSRLYDEISRICETDDNEQIFKYLFDFFDGATIEELIDFIKEEKGIN